MGVEAPVLSGWRRAILAGEAVRDRMLRASGLLEAAGVPYAVIGGNAVGEWVGRVDEGAVRFTKDVDIFLDRDQFDTAAAAAASGGFVPAEDFGVPMFLDGLNGKPSQAVHVIVAGEMVNERDPVPVTAPTIDKSEDGKDFRVLGLEALLCMKLVANRDKGRTHVRDVIGVGLVDHTWPARNSSPLRERLQGILDTPGG